MASSVKTRSLFDASIIRQAIVDSFGKLTPRRQVRNPVMFVVYIGSILTTLLWAQAAVGQGEAPAWFIFWVSVWLWFTVLFANFAEAMAEGRGKAQAASLRKARRDLQAKRLARPERIAKYELVSASALRRGRGRAGGGRRLHSGRRHGRRGRGLGERERDHRRERAGHPRERRRSQLGHRRHAGAVGLAHRRGDRQPGRGVPGPHDLAGRRRQAAEDAQRDRARHPAGGDDDHLPAGHRHAAAVLALRGGVGRAGDAGHGDRARRPARVPDSHHHRRAAVGHRHRRHGPHDPEERHRHVGPRGRGGRRRGRAPARQDGDDHAGQPPGHAVLPGARRQPSAIWPTPPSWPRWPTRRRRAAASSCWPRRSTRSGSATWRSSAPPSWPSRPRPG